MCDMSQEEIIGYVSGLKTALNTVEMMRQNAEFNFSRSANDGAGMDDYSCDIHERKIEAYDEVINKITDIVHRSEPGHDKPSNSF